MLAFLLLFLCCAKVFLKQRLFQFLPTYKTKEKTELGKKKNAFNFFSLLGDDNGRLDAARALLRVHEEVLAGLLGLPRHLARGFVVVELLDDEALGVLELLLGLEADGCKFFLSFFFFGKS
jgi:hypothetical protein